MVGLNKKLGRGGVFLGSSMTRMTSALIISSMLISTSMRDSSLALAAERKDVGMSSFNKRWKNSIGVVDDAAADGGKRVLVSDRRRSIIDEFSGQQFSFLATIFLSVSEHSSSHTNTMCLLVYYYSPACCYSTVVHYDTLLLHTTASLASPRMIARWQFVAGISGSGS